MEGDSNTALTRGICPKFWAGPPAWDPPPHQVPRAQESPQPSPSSSPAAPAPHAGNVSPAPGAAARPLRVPSPRPLPSGAHLGRQGRVGWGQWGQAEQGALQHPVLCPPGCAPHTPPPAMGIAGLGCSTLLHPAAGGPQETLPASLLILPPSSSCLHPLVLPSPYSPAFIPQSCLHPHPAFTLILPSSSSPAFILIQPSSSSCFHPPTLPPSPSPAFTL